MRRFPTACKAAWLSPARLAAWLRSAGYTGGISAAVLHGRLTDAAPGLDGAEGEPRGQITLTLVAMLTALNALNAQITGHFYHDPSAVAAVAWPFLTATEGMSG